MNVNKMYRIQLRSTGVVLGYKKAANEAVAISAWMASGTLGYGRADLVAVLA